jgi:RimJ/RimL family protein N-acetyltransferase
VKSQPVTVLRGERCIVRPWRLSDALVLPAIANDPDVARWLLPLFPSPYRLHDAQEWVRRNADADPVLNFALEHDGALAGACGLTIGEPALARAGDASIGYWVGRPFWRRGIATEAVTLLAEHAFAELGVRRLWANIMADNVPSGRVLARAGFVSEATLRAALVDRDGGVHDEQIYVRFAPGCEPRENG